MSDQVNFGDAVVSAEEKTRRVGRVFSSVARRYDLMNDLMSGGLHRRWKDRFVSRVKPRRGEQILDMAGGTGDIAFRMASHGAKVTVSDINADMLAVGMERARARGLEGLSWKQENAEALTFEDSSPIAPGETFREVFTDSGEYGYFCSPHPFMTGTVVVTSK